MTGMSNYNNVPQHDLLLMIGDMNAKVCSDNTNSEEAMRCHSCGNINDGGERLVNFCLNNSCVIDGTIFTHRDIHKLTWRSSDSHTVADLYKMLGFIGEQMLADITTWS